MQVRCKCLGGWCEQFFHIRPYVWTVGRRLSHVCVGREITSVCVLSALQFIQIA